MPTKLAETCLCGASVEVVLGSIGWSTARDYILAWRADHRHEQRRSVEAVGVPAALGGWLERHRQALASGAQPVPAVPAATKPPRPPAGPSGVSPKPDGSR